MRNYDYQQISTGPNELPAALRKSPRNESYVPHDNTTRPTVFVDPRTPSHATAEPKNASPNEERMRKNPRGLLDKLRTLIRSRRTYATPRENANAELTRFHRNSIMTPSPGADTPVIFRTKAMLLGTGGPHTFTAVTTGTRENDNHADGTVTSRRQLKGHNWSTVDCIIADKSSTRTMTSPPRATPSIPAPQSRRHRPTSPTSQPGPYCSHHDFSSILHLHAHPRNT